MRTFGVVAYRTLVVLLLITGVLELTAISRYLKYQTLMMLGVAAAPGVPEDNNRSVYR